MLWSINYIHTCTHTHHTLSYRRQYDIAINTVKLDIHHSSNYYFAHGALQSLPVSC